MSSVYNLLNYSLKICTGNGVIFPSTPSKHLVYSPHYAQLRYARRKGVRERERQAKLAKKLAEASKPKPTPDRILRKVKLTPDKQRTRDVNENWSTNQPVDDVWRTALYRGKEYDFSEILSMYRETHHPTMLNKPDAFIYATVELDCRTKKKTQFLEEFQGVMTYPHEFPTGSTNKVIALCKTEEDQTKAKDAGAIFVGGPALVKQILSGEIAKEEYDYVVCHPDTFKECNSLRGILKKKYPSAANGLLRIDVDRAVATFLNGVKYACVKSAVEIDFGWTNVCFGRLSMVESTLEENFRHMLSSIEKHKAQGIDHIDFITRVYLWCQQSPEKFKVSFMKYIPHYLEARDEEDV